MVEYLTFMFEILSISVVDYLRHKWQHICSVYRNNNPAVLPSLFFVFCNRIWLVIGYLIRVTWQVTLVEQELLTLLEHLMLIPSYLVGFVLLNCLKCFVFHWLSFCPFYLFRCIAFWHIKDTSNALKLNLKISDDQVLCCVMIHSSLNHYQIEH